MARTGAVVLGSAAWAKADDEFPRSRETRGADRRFADRPDDGHDHDDHGHDDHFVRVRDLPLDLHREFPKAISCNNALARADRAGDDGRAHSIIQQPAGSGCGTITWFLNLDRRLADHPIAFAAMVSWRGDTRGDVVFSVDVNGELIIDRERAGQDPVAIERPVRTSSHEVRVTLMVESGRGDNEFQLCWENASFRPVRRDDRDHGDTRPRREDRRPLDRPPVRPPLGRDAGDRDPRPFRDE
ncbi:MAG: hypothetical protein IT428_33420 [Planctomycetaceae bacterium]|nr:hypothetical protein [Planctomycetaceae bacterium]